MSVVAAGFFVVREAVGDPALLRRVHDCEDERAMAATVREIFAIGAMRDALWLASPEIVEALDRGSDAPRLTDALYRYLVRACTRCNPFGAFTSLALGNVAPRARFGSASTPRPVVRLDGGFVAEVVRRRSTSTRLRLASPFYRCGGHYRYVITKPGEGRVPRLVLAQVEADTAVTYVADVTRDGCELQDLVDAVSVFANVSSEEAAAYVHELRESGVLVAALDPALTGDIDFSRFEIELLSRGDPAGEVLREARCIAGKMANGSVGYAEGASAIRRASGLAGHRISEIVQVDTIREGDGIALPDAVIAEIGSAAQAFFALRLAPPVDPLADFKRQFAERWGDAAVALTTAVDADFGIPLTPHDTVIGAPLSAGLRTESRRTIQWHGTDDDLRLVDRALLAAQRGIEEIVVTPEEAARQRPGPAAPFTVVCAIEAENDDAIDGGAFRIIINAVGAGSAVRLLGRFCGIVPGLEERVRELTGSLAASHEIHADIVYSPSGRESNVIRHGRLYDFEIAVGGRGSAPAENTIHVEDLLLSLHGDELVLWDVKRGKRVRPHLSVAHNHAAPTNLALYRFLCRLEEQHVIAGGEWSWGPFANAHAMPRLRIGRTILARRRWTVDLALQRELARTTDRRRSAELLRRWKDESGCPDEILAGGIEERVRLDLTAAPALELFARLIRQGFREVHEALPEPSRAAFRAGGRRANHEIVVPFAGPDERRPVPAAPARLSLRTAASWTYLKCYLAPATSNDVIDACAAELRPAISRGAVDRWFFVRYADPETHLRLRFHGESRTAAGETARRIERALRPFIEAGRIWRLQHENYVAEPTRFGGVEALPHAERIFWRDSEAAVDAIHLVQSGGVPEWLAAIVSVDALMDDFGLDEAARCRFARARRDVYFAEVDDRAALLRHAAAIARKYRRQVMAELSAPTAISAIFAARSAAVARSVARLGALDRANRLTVPRLDVLASLVHMAANRIFSADQRMQEALALDLLALAYDAVAATRKETHERL